MCTCKHICMLHASHATWKGNMEHHNAIMPCTVMLPVILLTMIATKFWRNVATEVRTMEYGATIHYTEPQLSTRDMPLLLLWECGCQGREGWWSASADKISNASAGTWRGRVLDGGKVHVLVYVSLTGRHTDSQHLVICLGVSFGCIICLSKSIGSQNCRKSRYGDLLIGFLWKIMSVDEK